MLYTPTHREWLPLGQQVLDVDAFADRLGPDTVLLVRAHYFAVTAGQVPSGGAGGSWTCRRTRWWRTCIWRRTC